MALDFEPFVADLRAQLASAWPECKPNGIWDAEHVSLVRWADLTPPYAVLLIPDWPVGDWGSANLSFEPTVYAYYVAETAGKAVALRGKLVALVNLLWPTDALTTGQVTELVDVSVGDDLKPNQVLRDANRTHRAGVVVFKALMGITNS